MNRHKAKCDVLKKIRKGIADKLGIDLHQRECTFEGECTGTCPKCKQEEDILNREIARRAGALAVGATASLMLTACVPVDMNQPTGDIETDVVNETAGTPAPYDGGITYEEIPATQGDPFPPDEFVTDGAPRADDELTAIDDVTAGVPVPAIPTTGEPILPDDFLDDFPSEEDEEQAPEQEETEDEGTAGVAPDDGAN